jgi:hypothetical protein
MNAKACVLQVKFVCRSENEVFLRMITNFVDISLQMTTLVKVAFSPKSIDKPKHF